jgi:hypothetical protein
MLRYVTLCYVDIAQLVDYYNYKDAIWLEGGMCRYLKLAWNIIVIDENV